MIEVDDIVAYSTRSYPPYRVVKEDEESYFLEDIGGNGAKCTHMKDDKRVLLKIDNGTIGYQGSVFVYPEKPTAFEYNGKPIMVEYTILDESKEIVAAKGLDGYYYNVTQDELIEQ